MSVKTFHGHSTLSNGKLKSEVFQAPYFKDQGKAILGLVGDAKTGLKRHVEYYRSLGYTKIYIYDNDLSVLIGLQDLKHDLYPKDDDIIIRYGFAEEHPFGREEVDAIDFDGIKPISYFVSWDIYGKCSCKLDALFKSGASVVSLTCSGRNSKKGIGIVKRLASDIGVPYTQQDNIAMEYLSRIYPEYRFTVCPYRGSGGTPMFNIIGYKA